MCVHTGRSILLWGGELYLGVCAEGVAPGDEGRPQQFRRWRLATLRVLAKAGLDKLRECRETAVAV